MDRNRILAGGVGIGAAECTALTHLNLCPRQRPASGIGDSPVHHRRQSRLGDAGLPDAGPVVRGGREVAHGQSRIVEVPKANQTGLSSYDCHQMGIVIRNDVNIRKLEGLEVEEPRVLLNKSDVDLKQIEIAIDSIEQAEPVWMTVNLEAGQKTGFFLDQRGNIFQVLEYLKRSTLPSLQQKKVRILDLCCYVGHWSTQLVRFLKSQNISVEVHLLDISKDALKFAEENVRRVCSKIDKVQVHQADVLNSLDQFQDGQYDIVIADPPAFIKAKKDLPTGSHAYLKMNTHAFRLAAHKGLVVSCSCSGLMEMDNFRDILRKAQVRQSLIMPSVVMGGHSPDHPIIMSFPEGIYLTMIGHLKL
jgi:23S rRNA (cytosine1962-C5)-methyltransferase